uniref:Uncharacterized protein n=1 Tax=Arundo donax TaxID=35708 RepID=A0A0A9C7W6_ARUDO
MSPRHLPCFSLEISDLRARAASPQPRCRQKPSSHATVLAETVRQMDF